MAKQVGISKFTGRIDNVIGYRRNGVYCVRTMPETVRQTAATRRAARSFGIAKPSGSCLQPGRSNFLPLHIHFLPLSAHQHINASTHHQVHVTSAVPNAFLAHY